MTTKKTSTKEKTKRKTTWLKTNEKEIAAVIIKLAKQGLTSEKIGLTLRDQYGIPKAKLNGKSISRILKENNMYRDADISNLEKKIEAIKKHLEKNRQDKRAKRALTILKARLSKIEEYRKRKEEK